jgi:hypothetical protein
MREPTPDTIPIPCHGCSRDVVVPAGPVRAAARRGRSYILYCSRKCNLTHVAREGTRQQEELIRAGHSDGNPGGGPSAGDL